MTKRDFEHQLFKRWHLVSHAPRRRAVTKRDFEAIAEVLKTSEPAGESDYAKGMKCQWANTVDYFASMLATQNPRFDRARFLKACGLED